MAEEGHFPKMLKSELSFEGVNQINKKKQEGVMQRKLSHIKAQRCKTFEGIEGSMAHLKEQKESYFSWGWQKKRPKKLVETRWEVGESQYANIRSLKVMLKAMGSHQDCACNVTGWSDFSTN